MLSAVKLQLVCRALLHTYTTIQVSIISVHIGWYPLAMVIATNCTHYSEVTDLNKYIQMCTHHQVIDVVLKYCCIASAKQCMYNHVLVIMTLCVVIIT